MTKARIRALWILYRLTEAAYNAILQFQGGVCAGCQEPPHGRQLAVDHDHKTGRIRGLLCWHCNRAIGIARDRADALTRLGAYLDAPSAPAALGVETYGLIGKALVGKRVKVYGPPAVAVIGRKGKKHV
jgi:hypothetical protein